MQLSSTACYRSGRNCRDGHALMTGVCEQSCPFFIYLFFYHAFTHFRCSLAFIPTNAYMHIYLHACHMLKKICMLKHLNAKTE